MRAGIFVLLLLPLASVQAGEIEEIRLMDLDETIILRANGSAAYSFRGHAKPSLTEERVGQFRAQIEPRDFRRLTILPGAIRFAELQSFTLPFSGSIVRTTIVRDGKAKTLERHEGDAPPDPEPSADLWTLEMAVRGLAARIDWEPLPAGVRVSLEEAADGVREVMLREAGTDSPVASVRTTRREIEIPVAPGNYLVEVSELRGNERKDLWTHGVSVEPDKYAHVAADNPLQELMIQTPNHWLMRCRPDGSGILGYGALASDSASFKVGTIDFAAVVKELGRVATKEPPAGLRFVVMRREDKQAQPANVYTNDSKFILGLFERATKKEATERRGEGFDDVLKAHPPGLHAR